MYFLRNKMPIRNELLLADMDVLVCGLAFTGRTETVEDYFKTRVKSLVSIGISSCFLKENLSFCRVYEQGKLVNEFSVPNLRLKEYQWYRQPLMPFVVLMYFWAISLALRKVKKKYGLCIGISHSFGLWGVILKKVGVVRQCVYYCLDYYIPYSGAGFHGLFIKLLNAMDRFNVRKSDYVWDVSEKVSEYRQIYGNLKKDSYKKIIVPMGYSRSLRVLNDFDAGSRWNIGFVGSITANQGLQLLVEAMPDILKELPRVRVKIIGQGPFSEELKSLVKNRNLGEYFEFLGFIKNDSKMLDILSRCAIALAVYSDSVENKNIICADTGKPKLYALIGLPIVLTKFLLFSEEVDKNKAGISIDYTKEDLKNACVYLLRDESRLREFRDNSYRMGEQFISDKIYDEVIKNMFSLK